MLLTTVTLQLCNAYTELNDPVVQRQRFAEQLKVMKFDMYYSLIVGVFDRKMLVVTVCYLFYMSGSTIR